MLTPHDELLCHQLPTTFDHVSQSDLRWTERIVMYGFDRSGDINVMVGLARYPNRNVTDAYAMITRRTAAGGQEARVVRILTMVCGALAEAHGIGLIHRDIKPANIMLCTQGGERDVVKLLDFGLVKEFQVGRDIKLTGDSVVVGTPQYMAPESILNPDSVDARTDIYALGAVAYFLLAGTDVFNGKSAVEVCGQWALQPDRQHG